MRTIDFVFTMVKLINLFWVFFELPPIVNRKVNLVMSQKKWLFFVFSFVLPYVCKCWKNIFSKKMEEFHWNHRYLSLLENKVFTSISFGFPYGTEKFKNTFFRKKTKKIKGVNFKKQVISTSHVGKCDIFLISYRKLKFLTPPHSIFFWT